MSELLTVDEIMDTKTTIITEEQRFDDETRHPSKYFVVNAFGEGVYFHTRSRLQAQQWANTLYGKGFYSVRATIKASVT